ncbi:MAG: alcohol dehydrogenase catalytic domain-containing protein [Chloroflexi bacterium]|nr:alcohol dehydrogenase catalytic domain-containing protein [Chloroflexota bacterium]
MNTLSMEVERPNVIRPREYPLPQLGPDDGLLRVELIGICSSDVKIFRGHTPAPYPIIMGHEILGTIEEVGVRAAKAYGVAKGDRVIVEASVACGHCFYCRTGNYRLCDFTIGYGTRTSSALPPHLWGAYGQYMYIAPYSGVHKLSPKVPAEVGVQITTVTSNGIQWVRRLGGASVGDVVVVVGVGPQGLSSVAAARETGASLIVALGLTLDEDRLALAREMGAHHTINVEELDPVAEVKRLTQGAMADVVVEVSGSPKGVNTAINLARKQGTVVLAGLTGDKMLTGIEVDSVIYKEIRLQGAFSKGTEAVRAAISLVEAGKYPFHKLVTHRFPLARAEEALRCVAREVEGVNPVKVVLDPWAE